MSYRLQVLIPEELDSRLRKAASRSQVSKGEWVRRAIQSALEGGPEGPVADPVARLGCLNGPTGDIDVILDEIDAGR